MFNCLTLIMKAITLAGGQGKKLSPLANDRLKALVEVVAYYRVAD
jgi:choline kinase